MNARCVECLPAVAVLFSFQCRAEARQIARTFDQLASSSSRATRSQPPTALVGVRGKLSELSTSSPPENVRLISHRNSMYSGGNTENFVKPSDGNWVVRCINCSGLAKPRGLISTRSA